MEARRFPEPEVVGSIPTAGDLLSALDTWALSSVEERPFRIREVEGSNPSVSIFFLCYGSRTQAVKGVDQKSTGLCPRRFESCRLRLFMYRRKATPGGTRTHNLWLREPTPYPLGYRG